MTKKKKVVWFPTPKNLCEIYQKTGIHFAFVTAPKSGNKVCHEWVKCRDFMPDAVRTQITGKPSSIFGFTFNKGKNPPIDIAKTRVLVSKEQLTDDAKRLEFTEMMKAGLKLVNYYEAVAGVSKSKMYEVDIEGQKRYTKIFMFVGPKMWMLSPFLVSMYTFLIRLGHKKLKFKDGKELLAALKDLQANPGKMSDNDTNYLRSSWDKMEQIIKNRAELFPKEKGVHDIYWKDLNISSFHNNTGLLALATGNTPDQELNKRMKEVMSK
jgi:hypothetical protein